jgi:hypothetical protein
MISWITQSQRTDSNSERLLESAVTNARFASFHGLSVARMPLDHARSTPQNRALVTSGNAKCRISGGLPSAARRRRCAPTPFQPSLRLRSTVSARRPQTEARQSAIAGKVMNSPISNWPISDFPITDCKIASHSACRRDSAKKTLSIVWRRRSRQGYYGSLAKTLALPFLL